MQKRAAPTELPPGKALQAHAEPTPTLIIAKASHKLISRKTV